MKLNNTKCAANYRRSYNNSRITCLAQAYRNPSISKQRAYNDCLKKMLEMGGYGLRIIGYNSCSFTVGWIYPDSETGEIMLNVETYRNTYQIEY